MTIAESAEIRERWPVTVSVALLLSNTPYKSGPGDNFNYRLLLVRKRQSGLWALPSGGLEKGEELMDCALRELREEVDMGLEDISLPFEDRVFQVRVIPRESKTSVGFLFLAHTKVELPVEGIPVASEETDWVQPFTRGEIFRTLVNNNLIYKPEFNLPFIEIWSEYNRPF